MTEIKLMRIGPIHNYERVDLDLIIKTRLFIVYLKIV